MPPGRRRWLVAPPPRRRIEGRRGRKRFLNLIEFLRDRAAAIADRCCVRRTARGLCCGTTCRKRVLKMAPLPARALGEAVNHVHSTLNNRRDRA